jgi:hypothetical protein
VQELEAANVTVSVGIAPVCKRFADLTNDKTGIIAVSGNRSKALSLCLSASSISLARGKGVPRDVPFPTGWGRSELFSLGAFSTTRSRVDKLNLSLPVLHSSDIAVADCVEGTGAGTFRSATDFSFLLKAVSVGIITLEKRRLWSSYASVLGVLSTLGACGRRNCHYYCPGGNNFRTRPTRNATGMPTKMQKLKIQPVSSLR